MTFNELRNDAGRKHLRFSDLVDAAVAAGRLMTRHQIMAAIAGVPAPAVKRYGHWHYGKAHLEAVVKAAQSAAPGRAAAPGHVPQGERRRGSLRNSAVSGRRRTPATCR